MKKEIYKDNISYTDLKDMVLGSAKRYGDDPAFKFKREGIKTEISYNRFKKDVENLGTYLISKGFSQKKIALVGENSYEWVLSYFAVTTAGNVILPIDKELKSAEIASLLNASQTELLVYSKKKQKVAEELKELTNSVETFVCFDDIADLCKQGEELIKNGDTSYMDNKIDPEAMSAIIYTSGTTGDPKGVMLSQKNLVRDAYLSISCMKVPRDCVAVLPFNHTFGFMASIMCQLWMGYSIYINNSLRTIMSDIQEAKPGHISVVPLFVENMYKNIWKNAEKQGKAKMLKKTIAVSNAMRKVGIDMRKTLFKSVLDAFGGNFEMIISGGAPIDDKYMKGFDDFGITIINGFGITECSPIVALNRVDNIKFGTVGNAIPEVQVKINNPDENGEGEIWVKGDIVMMGYYNKPEETAAVLNDGWFNTEDIGKVVDGTFLKITGRKKNIIILANGKNVYPEELEYLISHVDNVTEVLVYGENDMITAEIYSDVEDDKENVREQIKADIQKLNQSIASYKQIRKIKFRSVEFEKTTTKKIKRNYNK